MLTATGTSATSVVPPPGRDSIVEVAVRAARAARACRASPSPSVSRLAGRSRGRRPRSRATALPSLRVSRMLDLPGLRVLDDVRQRLLHDAVERGLDLRRRAARRRAAPRARPSMPGLLAKRRREPLERRDEAEVVERLRPQLDREPADVLQRRRRRARAARRRACRAASRLARVLERSAGRAGSRSAPGRSRRGAPARGGAARAPAPRRRAGARRARRARRGRPRPPRARRRSRRGAGRRR